MSEAITDLSLDALLSLMRSRRATRHFKPDPLPDGVLEKLLEAARWAPSGYNLQPTHCVVVTQDAVKQRLRDACMNQSQVTEAPAVVVFTGDTAAAKNNFEEAIKHDLDAGAVDHEYVRFIRKFVGLAFNTGPVGLGWLVKATLLPWLTFVTPMPSIPAVTRRYWLAKQVSLAAMNFMLAAEAAGLATCPMEGFDDRRVHKVLGIPRAHVPVIITPVGYSATPGAIKTRLPLERHVHHERW